MPVDSSIAMGGQAPQFQNPVNALAQVLQVQGLQNQNSLFPLQMQQQQLAAQRAQQQWDMISPILRRMGAGQPQDGGGNAMTAAAGAPGASAGPQQGGAQPNALLRAIGVNNPQGVPTDDGIPYSLSDLGALSAAGYPGAKEMLDVKKAAMQGVKFDPGSTYNVGGKVFTVPQLDKGMQLDATGTVQPIPGYAKTNAGIQGAQAAATEGAKLLPLDYKTPNGVPIGGTQGEYVGAGQPGAPAAVAYQPPSTDAAGQPLPPQVQQVLSGLYASRDPAKLKQFSDVMTAQIAKLDPSEQQNAAQTLQGEIGKIQQAWTPQRPQLQSATEAATAAAGVKQANEPNLTYSTDAAKALSEKGSALAGQVAEAQGLLQRITQSREALTKFQSGGGAEWRGTLARIAQGIPGMPDAVVNGLAGGDLASLQVFQKFAAQEALETMRQSLASDNGKGSQGNRVAMQLFIKNNPNIDTDPNAIEKIFNFQTGLHNQLLNESDMFSKYVANPANAKDPAVFNNLYAHSQIDNGNVQPRMVQGQAKGTTPAAAAASGPITVPLVNPAGWQLHTDAQGNRAYVSPDGKQFQVVK